MSGGNSSTILLCPPSFTTHPTGRTGTTISTPLHSEFPFSETEENFADILRVTTLAPPLFASRVAYTDAAVLQVTVPTFLTFMTTATPIPICQSDHTVYPLHSQLTLLLFLGSRNRFLHELSLYWILSPHMIFPILFLQALVISKFTFER